MFETYLLNQGVSWNSNECRYHNVFYFINYVNIFYALLSAVFVFFQFLYFMYFMYIVVYIHEYMFLKTALATLTLKPQNNPVS